MDELERRFCQMLKGPLGCGGSCGRRIPCRIVCNSVNLALELCEQEAEMRINDRANPSRRSFLGIPFHLEKLTKVIPVKVGCNLKKAIPEPRSTWIRNLIIEALERMKEETG